MTNSIAGKFRLFTTVVLIPIPLLLLFFIDIPFEDSSRSLNELWNLGHIAVFAVVSYIFFNSRILSSRISPWIVLGGCLFVSICVGVAIELVQYGFDRNMDIGDVVRDVVGALIGLCFSPLISKGRWRIAVRMGTSGLLLWQLLPVALALSDEKNARDHFPQLSNFESRLQLSRWRGGASFDIDYERSVEGVASLKVITDPGKWSGIALVYFPSDWSAYRQLSLDLFSEEPDLSVTIRVHDREHERRQQLGSDRFRRRYSLAMGWNHIEISIDDIEQGPRTRKMDLDAIDGLGLFVSKEVRRRVFYIDAVTLK